MWKIIRLKLITINDENSNLEYITSNHRTVTVSFFLCGYHDDLINKNREFEQELSAIKMSWDLLHFHAASLWMARRQTPYVTISQQNRNNWHINGEDAGRGDKYRSCSITPITGNKQDDK